MIRTLTGAATLMLLCGSLASAQAVKAQQQPAGFQNDPTTGQHTAQGRIVAIGDRPQAGQPGQANEQPAARSGQESAQGMYITVASDQADQQPTAVLGDTDTLRDAAAGAANQAQRNRLNADQPGQGEREQGQPQLYRFLVTEETRIEKAEPGDAEAAAGDRPAQPSQEGLMEYRGLRVGQHVQVTYRPMAGGESGLANQGDQANPNRPAQASRGSQLDSGQAVRGEAVSIRTHSASSQGGQTNPDRPGQDATQPPDIDSQPLQINP